MLIQKTLTGIVSAVAIGLSVGIVYSTTHRVGGCAPSPYDILAEYKNIPLKYEGPYNQVDSVYSFIFRNEICFADIDSDGDLDLLVPDTHGQFYLYQNLAK